jgi:hypothetical protein
MNVVSKRRSGGAWLNRPLIDYGNVRDYVCMYCRTSRGGSYAMAASSSRAAMAAPAVREAHLENQTVAEDEMSDSNN